MLLWADISQHTVCVHTNRSRLFPSNIVCKAVSQTGGGVFLPPSCLPMWKRAILKCGRAVHPDVWQLCGSSLSYSWCGCRINTALSTKALFKGLLLLPIILWQATAFPGCVVSHFQMRKRHRKLKSTAKQIELKWKPIPGSGRCLSLTASGCKCPSWFFSGKQEWNTCNLFLFPLSDRLCLLLPCVRQWMIYSGQMIWPVFPMEAAMSIRKSQLNGWRQFTASPPSLWGHGSRKWAMSCIFFILLPEVFRKKKIVFKMMITQILENKNQ